MMSYPMVQLQSSIVMMPNLSEFHVFHLKGWQWVKLEKDEEKIGSIGSSKVDLSMANYSNLYDDSFFQQVSRSLPFVEYFTTIGE